MELSPESVESVDKLASLEQSQSELCESCGRITLQDLKVGFTLGTFQETAERAKCCQLCALILSSSSERWCNDDYDLSTGHTIVLQDTQGDLSSLTVSIVCPNLPEYRVKRLRVWVIEGIFPPSFSPWKMLTIPNRQPQRKGTNLGRKTISASQVRCSFQAHEQMAFQLQKFS
jgi:hypothetical protein